MEYRSILKWSKLYSMGKVSRGSSSLIEGQYFECLENDMIFEILIIIWYDLEYLSDTSLPGGNQVDGSPPALNID